MTNHITFEGKTYRTRRGAQNSVDFYLREAPEMGWFVHEVGPSEFRVARPYIDGDERHSEVQFAHDLRPDVEGWLGQILIDGKWLDYARGYEAESRRWQAADPESRRLVHWISGKVLVGQGADK